MLESDHINVHAIDLTKGVWFMGASGLPSGRRPIGYPMFLGLIYKIFGVHLWAAYAANLCLYLATAYLVYAMAKLIFSEKAGLLSAFLFTVYPISIFSVTLMTDEHLFLPLWYLGLYLLLRELKGHRVRGAIFWYGLIFGYAAMTRTNAVFMPFVVALAAFLMRRSWKKIVLSFIGVALMMQLVNLPWLLRNYHYYGVITPYTTDVGHYMYQTCNFSATPEGNGHVPLPGEPGYSEELARAQKTENPGRYSLLCYRELRRWILHHPKEFMLLGSARILYFMCWNRAGVWPIWFQYYPGSFDPARPLPQILRDFFEESAYMFYYALFFCSVFSVILLFVRRKKLSPPTRSSLYVLGACVFFWLAQHMIINPDRKYRYPLEPLMMMTTAYFLIQLANHFRPETK